MGSSITAFGANFFSTLDGALLNVTVLGELINFSDYLTGDGTGFLGFTSDTPFSSIVFDVGDVICCSAVCASTRKSLVGITIGPRQTS